MLPDGSHPGGAPNGTMRIPSAPKGGFNVQPKAVETSFEFGEYQPSCLMEGGGRRTITAGRRRSSPTNSTLSSATDKDAEVASAVDKVYQDTQTTTAPTRQMNVEGRNQRGLVPRLSTIRNLNFAMLILARALVF